MCAYRTPQCRKRLAYWLAPSARKEGLEDADGETGIKLESQFVSDSRLPLFYRSHLHHETQRSLYIHSNLPVGLYILCTYCIV
jgi:hypothetical protein